MKISVVTVCFNSEKTLERTLQSYANQDYPDKELILIDGLSKDGTIALAEKYRKHISALISEPDRGIYDAMNKGWQHANGEFVHFLNSDDWYASPQVLSQVARRLKNLDTIYHGRLRYQHEGGDETVMGAPCKGSDLKYELRGIHQPASFFPQSLFKKLGGFDLSFRISSDYELIRRFVNATPTEFMDLDVVFMSDSGASAKQIDTALKENFEIAVRYGESPFYVQLRKIWVQFWLRVRYRFPKFFRQLKVLKANLQK